MLGSANSNRINRYSSIYDFVHQRGQSFVPQKLPKGYKRGIIKECFRNALLLANSEPNLIYCEGYACGAVIPVYHAWCCDGKGKVLEVTWDKPGSEYIGVPIQTDYACKIVDRAGYYDQPHLTRSLKRWIGHTPAQIIAQDQPPLSFLYKTQPF